MISVRVRQRPDREHLQLWYSDPLTGNIRTKSAGTGKWKEAERAAARWESTVGDGGSSGPSWDQFRIRYEDEYLNAISPGTSKEYSGTLNKFESLIGSVRRVDLITSSVCSKFQAAMRSEGTSESTIAKHLRQLGVALNWAESIGMVASAPKINKPKTPKRNMRGRSLELFEVARFLSSATELLPCDIGYHWSEFLKAMWLTGLRVGEALALHHDRGPIRLDMTAKNPRLVFYGEGQKNNSDELVPLTPDAIRFFRSISPDSDNFVLPLPGERSDRVGVQTATRVIVEIGEFSEILTGPTKFVSSHDLRRTFGTRWALRVHPFVLKVLMRHADLKTTLKYYVDLDCDAIASQLVQSRVQNWSY